MFADGEDRAASGSRIARAWRSEAVLRLLQYAFMVAAEACLAAALARAVLFEYPGESTAAAIGRLPGLASSVVGVPVLFIGLWIWIRTGKSAVGESVRGVFLKYVARSRVTLALAALTMACVTALSLEAILASEPVLLSVVDSGKGKWRVFLDCTDTAAPRRSCEPPRELGDNHSAVVRVAKAGAAVVLESTAADHEPHRESARVQGDTVITIRQSYGDPPAFDGNRVVVAIYDFRPQTQSWSPKLVTKNIEDALALDGTPEVQVIRMDRLRDAAAADDWAARGFRPAVEVSGEFDSVEVRASFATSKREFAIRLLGDADGGAGEPSLATVSLVGLPVTIDLTRLRDETIAVNPSDARLLVEDYPRRIADTIRTLLALHFLERRAPQLAASLLTQEGEPSSGVHRGDAALRAVLRTSARIQLGDGLIDAAELVHAEDLAEQPEAETKGDIVVTGALRGALPRIAFSVFMAALAERARHRASGDFDEVIQRMEHLKPSTPRAQKALVYRDVFERSYGHDWRSCLGYVYGHGGFLMAAMTKMIESSEPHERRNLLEVINDVREQLREPSGTTHSLVCEALPMPDGPPLVLATYFRRAFESGDQCGDCDVGPEVKGLFEDAARACHP